MIINFCCPLYNNTMMHCWYSADGAYACRSDPAAAADIGARPLREDFVAFAQFFDSPHRYRDGDMAEAEADINMAENARAATVTSIAMARQAAGIASAAVTSEAAALITVSAARDIVTAAEPGVIKGYVDREQSDVDALARDANKFYSDRSGPLT
jgi:hypothetical protein